MLKNLLKNWLGINELEESISGMEHVLGDLRRLQDQNWEESAELRQEVSALTEKLFNEKSGEIKKLNAKVNALIERVNDMN